MNKILNKLKQIIYSIPIKLDNKLNLNSHIFRIELSVI